jgi:hypothetical protein
MISAEKQRRIHRWRSGGGVCYVCGQCLKSPFHPTMDNDVPIIAEVCPVRLCLMRFDALADQQEAHLIDNYTFLQGRRDATVSFESELNKYYESHILPLNPDAFGKFKEQLAAIFEPAVAIMQRSVADCTIPSCTACNKAMVKTYEHTMAVYKSFPVTAGSVSAVMEGRTNKANNARKVIQQIALYFEYDSNNNTWRPKTSHKILLDSALWRCMAFLNLWRSSGSQRMRLIAVFYASFYIYNKIGCVERFEEWHAQTWRAYCMANFASGTFLGYTHTPPSERVIVARLQHVAAKLALEEAVPQRNPSAVYDEKSLLAFMSDKKGAKFGADRLLEYFSYNFKAVAGLPRLKAALATSL